MFRAHGLPAPALHDSNDPNDSINSNDPNAQYLLKPFRSGGGHGIRAAAPGRSVRPGFYLQQRIDGIPGSVVFVAAAGRAVPLGVSRQLIGDHRFGAGGYRYCGNILAAAAEPQFEDGERLVRAAHLLADVAARELGLIGVNGIDFVARRGVPRAVEINPRWSASMELVERAAGVNVFAANAAACTGGEAGPQIPPPLRAVGKAVIFARRSVIIGDTDAWLRDPDIRDVPHAGDVIAGGGPVCTIFAEGTDAAACEAELVRRAASIYIQLERWPRPAMSPLTIHDSPFTISS
jgi:predicted ATP-grasp superfamily ATP-dependent carboligase